MQNLARFGELWLGTFNWLLVFVELFDRLGCVTELDAIELERDVVACFARTRFGTLGVGVFKWQI